MSSVLAYMSSSCHECRSAAVTTSTNVRSFSRMLQQLTLRKSLWRRRTPQTTASHAVCNKQHTRACRSQKSAFHNTTVRHTLLSLKCESQSPYSGSHWLHLYRSTYNSEWFPNFINFILFYFVVYMFIQFYHNFYCSKSWYFYFCFIWRHFLSK